MILYYLSIICITFLSALYLYYKHKFSYWKNRNIAFLEPSFPLGNINITFFRKFGQEIGKIQNKFKGMGHKYGGIYIFTNPVFIPTCPEVLKLILTKDSQYFDDRGFYCNEEKEFLTAHLASLSGPGWKFLRTKCSPMFTSSKLKTMITIMIENSRKLEEKMQTLTNASQPFDCKDLCFRFTTDLFCSLTFGIDCNSLTDPNAEFLKYGKLFFEDNFIHSANKTLALTYPTLFKKLNLKLVKKEFSDYFIKTISDIVEYREKNSIERLDFMNLLIMLKNNKSLDDNETNKECNEGITLKQLIAQCVVFYVSGVDTSATSMSYCLFELSQNEVLQNQLREEIHSCLKKHDGQLTYECIMEMQILDRIVSETLRKYPPSMLILRKCTKNYTIPGTKSIIEKGTLVFFSVQALHNDPEYYPDPEKFDPERFSANEKSKRIPYTYLPFGEGPRCCIAMPFGIIQVKIGIISLIKSYKFTLNSQTKLPLEFITELVILANYGKIWLDVTQI